jgi:hypothetical protein
MGDSPFLNPEAILDLSRQSLENLANHRLNISTRVDLMLAQITALISQSRRHRNDDALAIAERVVEDGLHPEDIQSTLFRVDLLAARADIFVARAALHEQDEDFLKRAWTIYQDAVAVTTGRVRQRFQACMRWSSAAGSSGYLSEACKAYNCAVDILPKVVFLGEDVVGRIEALRQVSGLASSSVATALSLNNVPAAIDFLEKTRGILSLQSFQKRAPQLRLLPKDLRDKFVNRTIELEKAHRLQWSTRRHMAEDIEHILSDIRCYTGFEYFPHFPILGELEKALQDDGNYAVVIVPSEGFCDIVMLGMTSGHSHMRISSGNLANLLSLSTDFISTIDTTQQSRRKTSGTLRRIDMVGAATPEEIEKSMMLFLEELWTNLMRPILEQLGINLIVRQRESFKSTWLTPLN